IDVENLEKRISNIQQFAGYFENGDGTIYPATFQSVSDKIIPGAHALVYATSTVPKQVDVSGLKLIVGKALPNATEGQANTVGFVSPNAFVMPNEKEAKTNLQKIDIAPYT